MQVNEEVPLIETANASNGQVLDTQKMTDLPNLGRNPFLLAKLSTNVVAAGDPRFNRFQDQSGSSAISVVGGPVRGNNYLIDGVPITDSTNRAVIIPSIEATQEMKLQTGTYDATMGRTGGGVFNTLLKSGTNDFHAAVLGYTRQTDWVANNFFYNANGTPRPDTPYYTWGGSFGGPVLIPKVYNGKNKTFFWVATESYRQKSPLSDQYALPTPLEKTGELLAEFRHDLRSAQRARLHRRGQLPYGRHADTHSVRGQRDSAKRDQSGGHGDHELSAHRRSSPARPTPSTSPAPTP